MARLAAGLRRWGWSQKVVPYTGYGAAAPAGWVRVLARVKLSPPSTGKEVREGARWWRHFFTVAVADVVVSVQGGSRLHEVRSGRGGYVDTVLPSDLEPGWHDLSLR